MNGVMNQAGKGVFFPEDEERRIPLPYPFPPDVEPLCEAGRLGAVADAMIWVALLAGRVLVGLALVALLIAGALLAGAALLVAGLAYGTWEAVREARSTPRASYGSRSLTSGWSSAPWDGSTSDSCVGEWDR